MNEVRLDRYRNNAYSALRFVTEPAFSEGIRHTEDDVCAGAYDSKELGFAGIA